ncbi:MAG TPA: hypothetical protein VF017_16020 [Thermoanaerobaculia bacterium]|nr:hypothetical protein [Thermoanaerobaculia bacterium]
MKQRQRRLAAFTLRLFLLVLGSAGVVAAQELIPIGVNVPVPGQASAASLDGEAVLFVGQVQVQASPPLHELTGRLFTAAGAPAGGEVVLVSGPAAFSHTLATASDGSFLLIWGESTPLGGLLHLFSRSYGPGLVPLGAVRDLGIEAIAGLRGESPALACGADQCVLAWCGFAGGVLEARYQRLAPDGTPQGSTHLAGVLHSSFNGPVSVALADDGSLAVAWTEVTTGPFATTFGAPFLALFDPADDLRSTQALEPSRLLSPRSIGLAWAPAGEVLVALDENVGHPLLPVSRVKVQRFDGQGMPLAPATVVDDGSGFEPALLWSPDLERFVLAWWSAPCCSPQGRTAVVTRLLDATGTPTGVPLEVSRNVNREPSFQVSRPMLVDLGGGEIFAAWQVDAAPGGPFFAQRLSATSPCLGFPPTPCISAGPDDRFLLFVNVRTPGGGQILAPSSRLTPDSVAFTFTSPDVPEVFAKMIDGTGLNDQFWTFYGSLTDQEFSLVVIDRAARLTRGYHNPPGRLASFGDTSAFPAMAPPPSGELLPLALAPPAAAAAPCPPVAGLLCLLDGQFYVEVEWTDFQGGSGDGQPVPATANGGYFTFFSPDNVEIAVKLLDGRAVNGHFWVFYASLTSVPFTLRIKDAGGNVVAEYTNPSGNMASVADVEAF